MALSEQEFTQKVVSDEGFREQLKNDPMSFMRSQGVNVPDGMEFEVVESTPTKQYIVLPPLQTGELSDDELATVQGGTICFSWSCSSDP